MTYTSSLMEYVTTFDGSQAPRRECRYIKGAFYKKHTQCFFIDDMWYRINSGYVIYDYTDKSWKLKSSGKFHNGIVGVDNGGEPQYGDFSGGMGKLMTVFHNGKIVPVLNSSILEGHPHLIEGMNGVYYFDGANVPKEFTTKLRPHKEGFYSFPFNYGSEELIPEFTKSFDNAINAEPLLSNAYKYLDDYTFGVEFETEKGIIPEKYLKPSGLIACKDGSISGFEYVTIPLSGKIGIQTIKNDCKLLAWFCSCSPYESMHIHIGGYPRNIRHLAALYRLGLLIQNEVYELFPYYYVDTSKFKKKGYCNPLPMVGESATSSLEIFSAFYLWLSGGKEFTRFPTGPHPMDRSGQHKWEVSVRYVWCNMIPRIWGGRETIEFRCHTPTLDSQKTINWLFTCVAILKYARKHATILTNCTLNDAPKITLEDILSEAYPEEIAKIISVYLDSRKSHYNSKNDSAGEDEIRGEIKGTKMFTLREFV